MKTIAALLAVAAAATASLATAAAGDGLVESYKGQIKADDRVIARGYEPTTSPDGSRIAFVGTDGDLYVARTDGRQKVRLTKTKAPEGGPAWSPNGRKIAYTRADGGLYVIDVATKKVRKIGGGARLYFAPAFSPDGRKIAYGKELDEFNSDLFVANADGSKPRQLTHTKSTVDTFGEEATPDFSPDGKRIVFVSNRTGNSELYLMKADGSAERRITNTPKIDEGRPRYSRDGVRLLYLRFSQGKSELAVSSANGGTPRILGLADSADWR